MNENEFKILKNKASGFKYTSLNYSEYEELKNYRLIHNDEKGILLTGKNGEKAIDELHWAANQVQFLTENIPSDKKALSITFIPEEWVDTLKERGFELFAIWNDYFKESLSSEETLPCNTILSEKEAEAISALTISCRGYSRGFTGQSVTFCHDWIRNDTDDGVGDKAVIGYFEGDRLIGCVFVATYGEKKTLWIREIVVTPDCQGKGNGRQLMRQAFAYGLERGVERCFLAADECNDNAVHLYQCLGFICNPKERQIDMIREG